MRLEIKRAFGLFEGLAFDGMGIDHGCSYIAMPQQLLNRTDIVIGLQKMACETVTEGMGRGAFDDFCFADRSFNGFLHMGMVKMITSVFF